MLSKHCARTDAALGGFPWFIDHCSIEPWWSTNRCHKHFRSDQKDGDQTEDDTYGVQHDRDALFWKGLSIPSRLRAFPRRLKR